MKYKKLSLFLLATSVTQAGVAGIHHCPLTYENSPFVQVLISPSDGMSAGTAECDYQHNVVYHYPQNKLYHPVGGNWGSAMPGFQWCNVKDSGNSALTCTFQRMYSKSLF